MQPNFRKIDPSHRFCGFLFLTGSLFPVKSGASRTLIFFAFVFVILPKGTYIGDGTKGIAHYKGDSIGMLAGCNRSKIRVIVTLVGASVGATFIGEITEAAAKGTD